MRGYKEGTLYVGAYNCYWSGSTYYDDYYWGWTDESYWLEFTKNYAKVDADDRRNGFPIRPVAE